MAYEVLRDTREQQGWDFGRTASCLGTVDVALKTGDYTLRGYEDILTVERKGSTSEIAANLTDKRFDRELERMRSYRFAFVVMEFTLEDLLSFPEGSGIPPSRWKRLRVKPAFLLKRLLELELSSGAHFIYAGQHGRDFTSSLFKRICECAPPTNAPPKS